MTKIILVEYYDEKKKNVVKNLYKKIIVAKIFLTRKKIKIFIRVFDRHNVEM